MNYVFLMGEMSFRISANNCFWLCCHVCNSRFFCNGDIFCCVKKFFVSKSRMFFSFFRTNQPKKPTPPPHPKRKGTPRYKPNPKFAEVNLII